MQTNYEGAVWDRGSPRPAAGGQIGQPGGVLELGYGQEESVPAILGADGRWEAPTVDPDFNDIRRVLTVRRARDS